MGKFNIERLEGKGVTAKVVDAGERYSTYTAFARAAGYPKSVYNGIETDEIREEVVSVLAKGNHEHGYDAIYVCQLEDGRQFLIGAKGLDLFAIPTLKSATFEELLDELMIRIQVGEGEMPAVEPVPTRADIVAQAQADIEGLKNVRRTWYAKDGFAVHAEFVINTEKRTVVALLRGVNSGIVRFRGKAKCDPSDCFNEHIGKAIALRRALGLDVPSEYLNAPQPEGVEVGDVVETFLSPGYHHATFKVSGFFEGKPLKLTGNTGYGYTSFEVDCGDRVINDTARY